MKNVIANLKHHRGELFAIVSIQIATLVGCYIFIPKLLN